jgi:hypothetical protein
VRKYTTRTSVAPTGASSEVELLKTGWAIPRRCWGSSSAGGFFFQNALVRTTPERREEVRGAVRERGASRGVPPTAATEERRAAISLNYGCRNMGYSGSFRARY